MITLYSGVPGSGKSAHAANDIRFALTKPGRKKPVLGNFALSSAAPVPDLSFYHCWTNNELCPDILVEFARDWWSEHDFHEHGILVVFDEVQLLWNSRSWAQSTRMSWLEFFSQHRKYGFDIILIAQSATMIDKQFRDLIEEEVNHRRLVSMGFVGFLVSLLFFGRLYMCVSYLFQAHERLGMSLRYLWRKDMLMYDSYATYRFDSSN